jgi:PIN domain nuclease of toxin-antitoxin system
MLTNIALTEVLLHYQHNHIKLSSNVSKWFDASKIHQSFIIKPIIHKEYYSIFNLN